MDTPIHLMNLGLMSLHSLQGSESLVSNQVNDIWRVDATQRDPTGGMETAMADAMLFCVDQVMQGNRFFYAVLDSTIRWVRDLEAGSAQMAALPSSRALHITPDSAGKALSGPFELTPQSIVTAMTGIASAMSQALTNAVEHDLTTESAGAAEPGRLPMAHQ